MSDDAGWAISRNADMVERLREENARLRADMVTFAAEMHARELAGYREREAEVARLEAKLADTLEQLRLATISDANEMARANDAEDERDRYAREANKLEAKLAKVVELHQRGVNPQGQEFCTHCVRIGWPCATLAAAKGE